MHLIIPNVLPETGDHEWMQYTPPQLQLKNSRLPRRNPLETTVSGLFTFRQPEDVPDAMLLRELSFVEPHAHPTEIVTLPTRKPPPKSMLFRNAIADARHTPESTLSARIKCCWRIVREAAIRLQLIAADEPLALIDSETTSKKVSRDSWVEGSFPSYLLVAPPSKYSFAAKRIPPMSPSAKDYIGRPPVFVDKKALRGHNTPFEEVIFKTAFIPPHLMTQTLAEVFTLEPDPDPDYNPDQPEPQLPPQRLDPMPGLSLLPPEVPMPWVDKNGDPLPDYDPEDSIHDPMLALWLQGFYFLAKTLRIDEGSAKDPEQGLMGLKGMFEPLLVRTLFPSRTQLMYYESLIVQEVSEIITKKSVLGAAMTIKDRYGMEPFEIAGIMSLARKTLSAQYESRDPETNRSMMLIRLEDYMERARENLNMEAEFKALKEMSLILGLTTEPGDSSMKDFAAVMRRIKGKSSMETLKAIDIESLPMLESQIKDV